mmetsp:Transcript_28761/g.72235  ORF Transcript_28761/g.72235 Transcript_28761/m.72235 type:complete len:424 (+) Transcript_28761:71-1342(+)
MSRPSRFEQREVFSPREHHAWASRVWLRMDRDNSGFLTRQELDCEEFRSILRKALAPNTGSCMGGAKYARAQMNMDQAVYFFMRKADVNSDNSISFREFKSLMQVLRQGHGAVDTADMIFALFDLDTDGRIDQDEFREIYRFFLGHEPPLQEFMEEWGRLDCEGAGMVSRDQYITWLQTSANPIFRWHSPGIETPKNASGSNAVGATTGGSSHSGSMAEPERERGKWRPWDDYRHFCWSEPTKGKPNHTKMKFRDTGRVTNGSFGRRRTASAAAFNHEIVRPEWNQNLATSHPNWPDKDGKPRQIVGRRKFFSRPQSLPELKRHLDSRPGFNDLSQEMFRKEKSRQTALLSHEHSGGAAQILSVASRGKPDGYMRHPVTRERKAWDDKWYTPFQLKDFRHPPPVTNIGAPARHLHVDLYEDEA